MRKLFVGLTALALSGMRAAWADEKPAPQGPDEDGTKPALVRIAGEGLMDSHAFQYLSELSDDVGARVSMLWDGLARHLREEQKAMWLR